MRILNGIIAIVAAGVVAASASGHQFDGYKLRSNASTLSSISYSLNGVSDTAGGGRFGWRNNSGRVVYTFCTELTQNVGWGTNLSSYDLVDAADVPDPGDTGPMGDDNARAMAQLYENHWDDVKSTSNNTLIRAFQMAVWEIAFDEITIDTNTNMVTGPGLDLSAGDFQTSDAASSTAQNWLTNIYNNVIGNHVNGIRGLRNLSKQDQMVAVPLPAPAMLAGLGLIGLVAGRKRLQKLAG